MYLLIFTQKWPRTFLRRYLWSIATMYACVCRNRNHIAQAMQNPKKISHIHTYNFDYFQFNLAVLFIFYFFDLFSSTNIHFSFGYRIFNPTSPPTRSHVQLCVC